MHVLMIPYYYTVLFFQCVTRQVTRRKSKSSAVVKHQRNLWFKKTHQMYIKVYFKSGFAPLYRSLVTFLVALISYRRDQGQG